MTDRMLGWTGIKPRISIRCPTQTFSAYRHRDELQSLRAGRSATRRFFDMPFPSGAHAALRHIQLGRLVHETAPLIYCLGLFGTLFDCLGHFGNRHERASNLVKKHVSVLFLRERLGK